MWLAELFSDALLEVIACLHVLRLYNPDMPDIHPVNAAAVVAALPDSHTKRVLDYCVNQLQLTPDQLRETIGDAERIADSLYVLDSALTPAAP